MYCIIIVINITLIILTITTTYYHISLLFHSNHTDFIKISVEQNLAKKMKNIL